MKKTLALLLNYSYLRDIQNLLLAFYSPRMKLTILIIALILPYIICPIVVKIAESIAIQNTKEEYKKHIFRNGFGRIFYLSLYTFVFVMMCGLLLYAKEIPAIYLFIFIPILISTGYSVFFKFLNGKPIIFIGNGTLVIKYLNAPHSHALKARFSQLSYHEPEPGLFVLYVLKEKAFEIDTNPMASSQKLQTLLRGSLPKEKSKFSGETIIERGVGKEQMWNEAFSEEVPVFQKRNYPFTLDELEQMRRLFEEHKEVDAAVVCDAPFEAGILQTNKKYRIVLFGYNLKSSNIVQMEEELKSLNLPYQLELLGKSNDEVLLAQMQADGLTLFHHKNTHTESDKETNTEKTQYTPYHIALAIVFGCIFIGFYISFFKKGEYDELYVLILGLAALACLYISKMSNIAIVHLAFAGISLLTFLFGSYFLNQKHLDGSHTVWGHNIGKADNYIERYYTTDSGEKYIYKGEYKTFKTGPKSSTQYWHGKGAWYKKYTIKTKAEYKNGKWIQHKKIVYKPIYYGTWNKNEFHGTGTRYWYFINSDVTDKYVGSFVNGEMTGKGTYYQYSAGFCGEVYKGDFTKGEKTGFGTLYFAERGDTTQLRPIYTGQWKDGEYHGHGTLYGDDGKTIIYEGEFENGKKVE